MKSGEQKERGKKSDIRTDEKENMKNEKIKREVEKYKEEVRKQN